VCGNCAIFGTFLGYCVPFKYSYSKTVREIGTKSSTVGSVAFTIFSSGGWLLGIKLQYGSVAQESSPEKPEFPSGG
jgi:hypothetical protein